MNAMQEERKKIAEPRFREMLRPHHISIRQMVQALHANKISPAVKQFTPALYCADASGYTYKLAVDALNEINDLTKIDYRFSDLILSTDEEMGDWTDMTGAIDVLTLALVNGDTKCKKPKLTFDNDGMIIDDATLTSADVHGLILALSSNNTMFGTKIAYEKLERLLDELDTFPSEIKLMPSELALAISISQDAEQQYRIFSMLHFSEKFDRDPKWNRDACTKRQLRNPLLSPYGDVYERLPVKIFVKITGVDPRTGKKMKESDLKPTIINKMIEMEVPAKSDKQNYADYRRNMMISAWRGLGEEPNNNHLKMMVRNVDDAMKAIEAAH